MTIIYITGLSGVGTTSALDELNRRGYRTIDTDYGGYVRNVALEEGIAHYLNEEKMEHLLKSVGEEHLFISGCCDNQGQFYKDFDMVVLLKADLSTMFERIENRTTNQYGKTPEQRQEILDNHAAVLPLLEKSSDVTIDTTHVSIQEVSDQLEALL
ncbi:AAA family ATPase [Chryseomicrobium sp. FSL W7-1435]|uniref:AAA family ATPase n=1 Tax=Chryseomicrobium sp. FSL W7-1435 TaxID=2921704 RepID=UPI003159EE98